MALQGHQPALSALVGMFYQVPSTCAYLGLMKASLTSKDQSEQDIEYLLHVLCHQGPCAIQERGNIFPSIIICLLLILKLCL